VLILVLGFFHETRSSRWQRGMTRMCERKFWGAHAAGVSISAALAELPCATGEKALCPRCPQLHAGSVRPPDCRTPGDGICRTDVSLYSGGPPNRTVTSLEQIWLPASHTL
jgi:hypothetical protein